MISLRFSLFNTINFEKIRVAFLRNHLFNQVKEIIKRINQIHSVFDTQSLWWDLIFIRCIRVDCVSFYLFIKTNWSLLVLYFRFTDKLIWPKMTFWKFLVFFFEDFFDFYWWFQKIFLNEFWSFGQVKGELIIIGLLFIFNSENLLLTFFLFSLDFLFILNATIFLIVYFVL